MQVNVAQLLKEPVGSSRSYDISQLRDQDDGFDNLQGGVWLLRTDQGILLEANLKTSVEAECSRCLESFPLPLELNIEEEYFPTVEVNTGVSLLPPPEPEAFVIDHNHILDLTDAVRQYTLMAMPMKPLCRPDCPGFCPQCGRSLKNGPCGCPPEVEPRWEALKKLAREVARVEKGASQE